MRLRRVIWNPWQSNGKIRNIKSQSFEALKSFAISKIRNARRGSKEKIYYEAFLMTIISATFGALPEVQFMHAICRFELRKSTIQCFKRYTIRSWNEGVTAIAIRSLQVEGRMLHGCEITLLLRNDFAAILHSALEFLLKFPDICDRLF